MKLRVLGCGTSFGVLRSATIGAPATPPNPATAAAAPRSWSSMRRPGSSSTPVLTLREQLLEAGVERLDAVIWTHDHADHCHGIDDLRAVFHARGGPVPGWARAETLAALRARFGYAFEGKGAIRQ